MFYNYKILEVNGEEVLYLYVNSMYEFSNELDSKNKPKSLFHKVVDYLKDMDIHFNGKKVLLVVNGLIIGSLMLITNDFSNIPKENAYIAYHETVDIDKSDNVDVIDSERDIKSFVKNEIATDNDGFIVSNFVKMRSKDGKITFVDLNNYITNELSKTIPPTYEKEAIKCAAVITRTKVFRDLYENNYLEDDNYRDITQLKKVWKNHFSSYFNKLKSAVEETSYQYLSNSHYYFNFQVRDKYQVPYSSYGANLLAKSGYEYTQILGHYYPDALLETV